MNITVLTNNEEFIRFLDPELCEMTETIEKDGLRTLHFTYYFQDMVSDKELFRIGNKLWVHGDSNLADCLYVINTSVKQDIYQENCFTCEMEEVLVELNYAPVFTQNELSTANGFTFSTNQSNEEYSVLVNWNSLNYWFGEYFNIGVVQKCISDYQAKIGISGTINLMTLLRKIEEETGNIFVTRYEKDCINNTIHRYLDFLNPINVSKPWVLNLEYDFLEISNTSYVYTEDGEETTDTYEDVYDKDDVVNWSGDYTPVTNINPENIIFRITNELGELLGNDGLLYQEGVNEPLQWASSSVGFQDNTQSAIISLQKEKDYIGLTCNEKEYVILDNPTNGDLDKAYTTTDNTVTGGNKRSTPLIPDDSYFELYDTSKGKPVFRTRINYEIGHVHEEILDFGFNLDNITLEVDETDTYTAITPVLVNEGEGGLTRANMADLITKWKGLSITKGDVVPMIVEKITVQASSLDAAKTSLGTFNVHTNYWSRPYKPNDNVDSDTPANSTWEFYKATAYWKAPYTKVAGEFQVDTDVVLDTEYTHINGRPDTRDGRDIMTSRPKMGNVETTAEDIYVIYNLISNKLREKQSPGFNLTVDVSDDSFPITAFLNISFSHHVAIFRYAETYDERKYYIQLAYNQRLKVDDLEEMIKARVYDHRASLPNNFFKTIPEKALAMRTIQMFKDSYLLDYINVEDIDVSDPLDIDESVIESKIVMNIKNFIMTFGKSFTYKGHQVHYDKLGHDHWIDLLFYNRELKSLVVVELKKGQFKPRSTCNQSL